jgi:hypothetical protein
LVYNRPLFWNGGSIITVNNTQDALLDEIITKNTNQDISINDIIEDVSLKSYDAEVVHKT